MQVRDIMTGDITCCTPYTSLQQAAQMMVDCDCGAIPVIDSENDNLPIGIITDRDIACRVVARGKNPLEMTVGAAMSEGVTTIPVDASIEECCAVMERAQVRRMPVVDGMGQVCGIVTQADIARHLPPEAVGDVVERVSAPSEHASTLR